MEKEKGKGKKTAIHGRKFDSWEVDRLFRLGRIGEIRDKGARGNETNRSWSQID